MAYIGNTPGENFISFSKQVFTIVNSQTAYSLDHKVTDENELRLVINNVVQEPGTGKAYTASGNTLTIASALTNGTDEMYCIFLGKARETSTVPDSFITKNKLNLISTSSSAGLEVKGDGSSQDGYLQLNCSQNSHGVKIKSPPHSAGQSYTLTLPQSISADTFLKTDGSGNLSFASAGETNSPYFRAYIGGSSSLSDNVTTKVVYDTTSWNVGGTYSTGTYRWTPGVQGRYFIHAQVTINWSDGAGDRIDLLIRKNGSNVIYRRLKSGGNFGGNESSTIVSGTVDLDSDDYVEVFCEQHSGSARTYSGTSEYNFWEGFLIATY